MAGPFDVAHPAAGSSVSLGAAAPAPLPTTPMGMMGLPPPAAPAQPTMGSLGAQVFPTVAALPVGPRIVPQPQAAGAGLGAVPSELPPPAPGRDPTQLEQAQAAQGSENETIAEILARNRIKVGSKANPLRPLVEAKAQFQGGGGWLDVGGPFQPQPTAALPRNEGNVPGTDQPETDEEYAARQALFEETDIRQQKETYDRMVQEKIREAQTLDDVRDVGASGHLGMGEAQLQVAEDVGGAELTQAERVVELQGEWARMQAEATEQAKAAEQERLDDAEDQKLAIEASQTIQTEARKKLQELPPLDRGRFWKSQSGASKFMAYVGAIAGGMIGSTAVPEHFERMAQADLEEQQANAAQVFDQAAAADQGVSQAASLYQQVQDAAGDKGIGDQMWLNLQREDMADLLEAEIAKTNVPVQRERLQATLLGVRQTIEQQKQAIDLAMATTKRRLATRHDPLGGKTRERLLDALDKGKERSFELTKLGVAGEEKGLDREAKRTEKQADVKAQKTERAQELAARHAKEVSKMDAASSILKGFVSKARKGDIAGRGLDVYFATEDGRKVRESIKEAMRRQLRFESQGVIGDDEIEDRVEAMFSGFGDNELLDNVERLIDANNREIQAREYGLPEESRQIIYRNPDLPPLERRGASLSRESKADDAAALGGKVVQ